MNRRLVVGGMTSAVVLALAIGLLQRTDRPAPASRDRASGVVRQDPILPAEAKDHPELSRAFATYRLHEESDAEGIRYRGIRYSGRASRSGFLFQAEGFFLETSLVGVVAGDREVAVGPGTVTRPSFGVARIDRGNVIEEYAFDNRRVEQLFRIPQPLGPGGLTLRSSVRSDLGGPVIEVPRYGSGWRETPLLDGGLAFCDAAGTKKLAYHGAVAIDATGRRQELDAHWTGGEIALHVPESFLAHAAYPVVIDPWLELNFSASGGGMSNTANHSQTPAMAIDGGGNPYIAWSEQIDVNNFEIYFRYWNGFSWFGLAASDTGGGVSLNPGNSTNPSIALDTDGSIYIAWQDDTSSNLEIYLKKYDITKGQWIELDHSADPTHGLSQSIGESTYPSVAVMQVFIPSTNLPVTVPVVAWQDTSSGTTAIHLAAYFPGDPGRENDTANDPGPGPGIPLAFDENFPVIDEGWYGFGTTASAIGNSFDFFVQGLSSTPIGRVSERPKLAMTRIAGVWHAFVAWQDTRNNNYEIYSRHYVVPTLASYDRQTIRFPGKVFPIFTGDNMLAAGVRSWAATGAGSDAGAGISTASATTPSLNPSIAVDPAGTVYVAWEEQQSATNSEVFESDCTLGGAFTGPTNVSNTAPLPPSTISRSSNASIAVDGSFVYVAWVDDQVTNTEIYVRRRAVGGGAWTEIGFNAFSASIDLASTQPVTGISKTFSASLFPQIKSNGSPVVVWQDFANANFDIYVRRFFENEPRRMRQTGPLGAPVINFGGLSGSATIELRGTLFTEDPLRRTRMEVEVKPIGSPFVGTLIQTSGDVTTYDVNQESTVEAVVSFTGVVNTQYHWRVRTVNDLGQYSSWISAGSNVDGQTDFGVSASPGVPPAAPTNLTLTAQVTGVQAQWTPPVGGADSYILLQSQIPGQASTGGGTLVGSPVPPSQFDATVSSGNTYFYSVAAVRGGLTGPFSLPEATILFTSAVSGATPPPADEVNKKRCGLMGGEALLALAAIALFRRRRR
jgi:hypothetical protein